MISVLKEQDFKLKMVSLAVSLRRRKLWFLSSQEENRLSLSKLRSLRDRLKRRLRLRMHWPMLYNQPVMTATCSVSSLRKSRRQRLSCSGECQRPTVRLLSGEPNMKLMPSSAQKNLKSPRRSWLSVCKRQRNKLRQ
uniref:(northern house mosquito) hypothetical protein n=1 Tax=Culex pipiens TaxID=7175 RepID=A0A8D8HJA2_CULPI